MLFSKHPRIHYEKAPAHEVICQLRFPAILSINCTEPVDFQEAVRNDFPQYARREEMSVPQLVGVGGPHPKLEQQPSVINYNFISADNLWKLNLTKDFIALSTLQYTGWEEFARRLDKPLAEFIAHYQPAFFQRVGLRYINVFSKRKMGLTNTRWADLISAPYTGPLGEPDAQEKDFINYASDFLLKLDSSCQAKIHAGTGHVKTDNSQTPEDPEVKFILDMDLSMGGNVACTLSAGALETLHIHAGELFEGAVTDRLRTVMEPEK